MANQKRILFVDDETYILQGLQRTFRPMRGEWDMAFADSGQKGLQMLAEAPFDVVVSDLRMPSMNGAEFLNRVQALYPRTIRLVLSGHADRELILKALGAAHQVLSKPCDPALLRAVIQAATEADDRIHSEELRNVLGRITHLPVMPAIYKEIMVLLESEGTSLAELGAVIERDQGMTANLLKVVNSAFFGLRHRVSDPADAVSFLGVETLKSLTLLYGVFDQLMPQLPAEAMWRHSLQLAAAARQLAVVEGEGQEVQVDSYTAGLLHDVGLLVLASSFPAEYRQVSHLMAADGLDLIAAETRVLGVHHGELGAHLLGLWGLPDPVVRAVGWHHAVTALPAVGFNIALAVHAAEILIGSRSDAWLLGRVPEGELQALSDALGVRMETWRQATSQVLPEMEVP
jgi:HD-like signal output (HDOD) protein/CheY-like chemotaxis protein